MLRKHCQQRPGTLAHGRCGLPRPSYCFIWVADSSLNQQRRCMCVCVCVCVCVHVPYSNKEEVVEDSFNRPEISVWTPAAWRHPCLPSWDGGGGDGDSDHKSLPLFQTSSKINWPRQVSTSPWMKFTAAAKLLSRVQLLVSHGL